MTLGKIGTTISKEINVWAKTSKRGLLATRPIKVNIKELKYAPEPLIDTIRLNKKHISARTFFQDITEDVQIIPNPFKPGASWTKRIVHGKQPISQPLQHSFTDTRLAQPIKIEKHCNQIQTKSSTLSDNYVKQYLYKDEFNQARIEDYLYLDIIEVQERYRGQGVASKLLDKIIAYAQENFNGRFKLTASTPTGCTNSYPPALVYWKKGFRFINEEENKTMQKVLQGQLPVSATPEHTSMFLDKSLL